MKLISDLLRTNPDVARNEKYDENSHCRPIAAKDIIAATRIYQLIQETALQYAPQLSQLCGRQVYCKREDLHSIFSFKIRGAANKILRLLEEDQEAVLARGVVACSAGNHAQGVAAAAKAVNVNAKIFMPVTTQQIKIRSVMALGATVVLTGNTFDDCQVACLECVAEENRIFIPPFDDDDVMAGNGTAALEVFRQFGSTCSDPTLQKLEAVFVPCGGGGLAAGVGSLVKSVNPEVTVVAVEAGDAAGMYESFNAGKIVKLAQVGSFADGTAVSLVGRRCFDVCFGGGAVDAVVRCSTDEICAAVKSVFEEFRIVLEPSGALAVAGATKVFKNQTPSENAVVAFLSGANVDFARLRFISDRTDITERRVALAIVHPEGALRRMCAAIMPRQVTGITYARSLTGASRAVLSFQAATSADFSIAVHELKKTFAHVLILQDNEFAKAHGKHMIGDCGNLKESRVFRASFPEKPGALRSFLEVLPESWDVDMFHYRNFGADTGDVSLSLRELRSKDTAVGLRSFIQKVEKLGFKCIEETENEFCKFVSSCRFK